jgi:dUTP pyrophosphatase
MEEILNDNQKGHSQKTKRLTELYDRFCRLKDDVEDDDKYSDSGISIDDLVNHSDEIVEQMFNQGEVELSQPKKDFVKFLFTSAANAVSSSTINPAHIVEIPVVLCRENAKLPTYATNGAGAMDIYSPEEYTIDCGKTIIIPIGIKVSIPHGYGLLIQPRSGMSARMKIRIPNTPGLIDEDYHEEIGVIVENTDQLVKDVDIDPVSDHTDLVKLYGSPITIGKGERFAQMRLVEIPRVRWREVESFGGFKEDHGEGFGHSGQF